MNYDQVVKIRKVLQVEAAKDLIDDLGLEFERMTPNGQATYKQLCALMGWKY